MSELFLALFIISVVVVGFLQVVVNRLTLDAIRALYDYVNALHDRPPAALKDVKDE